MLVGGGAIAALIVLVGGGWWLLSIFRGQASYTPELETEKTVTEIVVALDESVRSECELYVDRRIRSLRDPGPTSKIGQIRVRLTPGKHSVLLKRRGYEQIEQVVVLEKGQSYNMPVTWKSMIVEPPPVDDTAAALGSAEPPGYSGWVQGMNQAQRQAAEENKDILLAFVQSDADSDSQKLSNEVFQSETFNQWAHDRFVLVLVDLPATVHGRRFVVDMTENMSLVRRFRLIPEVLPVVALADGAGRPYAIEFRADSGVDQIERWGQLQGRKTRRDELFRLAEQAQGAQKLAAAATAVDWIDEHNFLTFYKQRIETWAPLAGQFDPRNEQGRAEVFFSADWRMRFLNLVLGHEQNFPQAAQQELSTLIEELETWSKKKQIRDPNRAARLYYWAAVGQAQIDDFAKAAQFVDHALAQRPKDESLRARLRGLKAALNHGSGTGFVVAPGGYVLTNYHVIRGKGDIHVKTPRGVEVPAKVLANNEQLDMALLKVDDPELAKAPALVLAKNPIGRGVEVAAFGFPLGDEITSGLKLTRGVVSGVPDSKAPSASDPSDLKHRMYLLDCRVNPGNSGGPLCDRQGKVVGMITAKSISGDGLDSYGMALPAEVLREFLKSHLPPASGESPVNSKKESDGEDQTAAPLAGKVWSAVDAQVSPSVVMILKLRG